MQPRIEEAQRAMEEQGYEGWERTLREVEVRVPG